MPRIRWPALPWGPGPSRSPREGWSLVTVKAAALNHHDLWTLRGVGIHPEQLPMVLGGDAAGVDEHGNEVVVHSVVCSPGWTGDDTLDPRRSLLSEVYDGTLAEQVLVQGAGGGVSTAAIILGAAAGYRMWVTSRSEGSARRRSGLAQTRPLRLVRGCPPRWTRSSTMSGRRRGRIRCARWPPAAAS